MKEGIHMEAYFDGLRVFQSPDNDIMVIRDERPVMHIACTKQLKKRELIQTVRELREMVIAERKARNRMNLYSRAREGQLQKGPAGSGGIPRTPPPARRSRPPHERPRR